MNPDKTAWRKVLNINIQITKSSFHILVGGARIPVRGGSGVLERGSGSAELVKASGGGGSVARVLGLNSVRGDASSLSDPSSLNHDLLIPANLLSASCRPRILHFSKK